MCGGLHCEEAYEEFIQIMKEGGHCMAVEIFEVGKFYQWVGPDYYHNNWNEEMDVWKDGKPRKCTKINLNSSYDQVTFENICGEWDYSDCREYFVEVPDPRKGGAVYFSSSVGDTTRVQMSSTPFTLGYLQDNFSGYSLSKPEKSIGFSIKSKKERRKKAINSIDTRY